MVTEEQVRESWQALNACQERLWDCLDPTQASSLTLEIERLQREYQDLHTKWQSQPTDMQAKH